MECLWNLANDKVCLTTLHARNQKWWKHTQTCSINVAPLFPPQVCSILCSFLVNCLLNMFEKRPFREVLLNASLIVIFGRLVEVSDTLHIFDVTYSVSACSHVQQSYLVCRPWPCSTRDRYELPKTRIVVFHWKKIWNCWVKNIFYFL